MSSSSPEVDEDVVGGSTIKAKHVVFVHLDLGIGGAEQLVINLAMASLSPDTKVTIYTAHCSQSHCFAAVKKGPAPCSIGPLAHCVQIRGRWLLPLTRFAGTAFSSTLRMMYLTKCALQEVPDADLLVMDVLPTPLWLCASIKTSPATLYYCHFPDKLLTRDTVNGIAISSESSSGTAPLVQSLIQPFRKLYRGTLDALEEYTLPMADFICVNSEFTKQEVERVFPSIQTKNQRDPTYMQVLYPPIDLADFIPPQEESSSRPISKCPIVSLNRFERKKNIGLLLNAYALLVKGLKDKVIPPLVIAGGYDVQNVENVEYLAELRQLASTLGILEQTLFRPSVSDQERAQLLQEALVVVYTPDREHFGIVPLEAMYAGSPVVAVNSGGPRETVRHNETGFLCSNTPASFCEALEQLVRDPDLAHRMGQAGHEHVTQTFGLPQFRSTWSRMVTTAKHRRLQRRPLPRSILFTYLGWSRDVIFALLLAWLVTFATKTLGIIPPSATVWGHVKTVVHQRFAKDEF